MPAFLNFLETVARRAERLYILGDLFDLWLGDDDPTPPHPEVVAALSEFTATGVPTYVMPGNHDFTLGGGFEEQTGCRLLSDPCVVDLYGSPVLLTHGDALCTDDTEYQAYRSHIRDETRLSQLLSLPLEERMRQAESIRTQSDRATGLKPQACMDVSRQAVEEAMGRHRVRYLIHGHTHREGEYRLGLDGGESVRIALGDWRQGGRILVWERHGYRFTGLEEPA